MSKAYLSNVVSQEAMRKIQSVVLEDLAVYLKNSFGPKGSNTCIKELNALNMYTKDGFTILKKLMFNGIIEQSIKDDIETITKNVATTVGDGTTSAVLLSNYIFRGLIQYLEKDPSVAPADVVKSLNACASKIKDNIMENAMTPTIDSIRDIAFISSNGNEWITNIITDIYKEFGMEVFIDVSPSLNKDTSIKYFDGMTINTGYSDSCFITDTRNNSCVVDKPNVFFFEDPVDNKEMGVFFDSILSKNIMQPINENRFDKLVPTVVVAPHVSRDMSSVIDAIVNYQSQLKPGNKLPFLLITDTHQVDEIQDLYKLCGARPIHKYIDSEIYKKDVESGVAPTPDTVIEWAGTCDQVVSHSNRTKFINPSKMKNEDGSYSNEYLNLLSYFENEISKLEGDGDIKTIGLLKRRLHSLKSNLIEISVGGMTVADRDSNRHLFEDSVLNCRSAAKNGIGWGANVSGYLSVKNIVSNCNNENYTSIEKEIFDIISNAYYKLVKELYATCMSPDEALNAIVYTITHGQPINLRTMEFDGSVKSSIESDCIILESVVKIIGIMVTCNQFVVPTPQHNVYTDLKEI